MSRRRQTPWIHRWSRLLIAAIASIGALGTGYLTVVKLVGGSAACPTSGCNQVLSSPYATVFGLPLTLFGFLAYVSMALMAVVPLVVNPESKREIHTKLDNWTWLLMFAVATAMVIFSGYLMYLLAFQINALCIYCITSAVFTVAILALTLVGRSWEDSGQLFFTGVMVGMVALIGTLSVYSNIGGTPSTAASTGQVGLPITATSGPAELALARHLRDVGATMYGAYWCPHCSDQKQMFGQQAAALINYVECAPDGQNSQTALCQSKAEVTGFPTWEINGQFYPGTQSLQQLADITNYHGSRSFRN